MSLEMYEYETTCGIVFDGELYCQIKTALFNQYKTIAFEEHVDIYSDPQKDGSRYRALTIYSVCNSTDDVPVEYKKWDKKQTLYSYESQIPFIDTTKERIAFITCTYKESSERSMTSDEWTKIVTEDHTTGLFMRLYNKKRICFYEDAFDTKSPYTRVSIGKHSSYGGTLESRSTCDSLYYLEIELESKGQLNGDEVQQNMHALTKLLFQLVPYDLVKMAMMAANTGAVQRERLDNIFDTFKRTFRDYKRCASELREKAHLHDELNLFIMPKWNGVRATGLYYCKGYLTVKDACGRLTSFNTHLPFDNDMILQLEVVETERDMNSSGINVAGRFYVITELMAVLIKSKNTLFQVYGRNNAVHDTGRNIGNVAASIAMKAQFADSCHVCNL